MILGRFKQWTGEKFGGAKVTLQTEDFQRLEQETERRRQGYEEVVEAVDLLSTYLLKRKTSPDDNKMKSMPLEALGTCMHHYGTVFPEHSPLGKSLINLGQTETRIAALQEALAMEIKAKYQTILEAGLKDYKEFDALRKKLASRRLDYDSKLNRLNKAKREKPELEQEMQAAKIKYEETENDLIHRMAYLEEFETVHRNALYDMLEAQCSFHTHAKDLLESLKKSWGDPPPSNDNSPCDLLGKVMVRSSTNSSVNSISAEVAPLRRRGSPAAFAVSQSMSRDISAETHSSQKSHNHLTDSLASHAQLLSIHPTSEQPTLIEEDKLRRALYDFTSENTDEISFKTGDIILVLSEIDKGWWLGELNGKRGIFPVNYTEDYDLRKRPLPPVSTEDNIINSSNSSTSGSSVDQRQYEPAPPTPSSSTSSQIPAPPPPNSLLHQKSTPELTINTSSLSSPRIGEGNRSSPSVYFSTESPAPIRRPPLPPVSASSPSIPTSRKPSLTRQRSTAIRAPPPPPPPPLRVKTTIQ
ncbi:hypothetical protein BDF20DRAFT_859361 [Mycotypha africana]|uniref:uncharacterized protein n=1 Tax=Mycotypha africana TaxID=64632 RepID=UPI0023007642|nr:uncharacterized protein BDF20DRAFT_859361 [Mycotypha africana]KAI8984338.1 hypothetical protein BDF20DRAFT_859361 [Mycotypha africana]